MKWISVSWSNFKKAQKKHRWQIPPCYVLKMVHKIPQCLMRQKRNTKNKYDLRFNIHMWISTPKFCAYEFSIFLFVCFIFFVCFIRKRKWAWKSIWKSTIQQQLYSFIIFLISCGVCVCGFVCLCLNVPI